MQNINNKISLFKKIDLGLFENIDKFKKTPNYNTLQDFYNSLDEEQQKALKASIIFAFILIPALLISLMWWQNSNLKNDLNLRSQIISKANEILGQKQSLGQAKFSILADSPIDSDSMMVSRLSTILSSMGGDLSKIKIKNFNSSNPSSEVMRTEATLEFSNFSTDELINLVTGMIQNEKFRISQIEINRNPSTNLLQGNFQAIHFSSVSAAIEEQ
jgi:hypothetical protein